MMTRASFIGLAVAVSLASADAAFAADTAWDTTVKAAIAEGEVDVQGGPGKLYEQVLTQKFKEAYPQIKVNFSGLSGRDAIPKILRERAAGIYGWDVYVGGVMSVLLNLKPAGALAPLKPNLVLPDVLDDRNWFGGLDAGFMDVDRKYVLAFEAEEATPVLVNWDFVRHADLQTMADLAKPEFANKIVWDDPRLPGTGSGAAMRILVDYGADFLARLFTQQKIVYTATMRQNAEWLVRGRYPIGLGTGFNDLAPFQEQGLGLNVSPLDAQVAHPAVTAGFGTVSVLTHAPHPNAAKVYVNWLLGRPGQIEWEKTGFDSRRLDITHVAPRFFPKPGIAYVAEEAETGFPERQEAAELAKKYIGTQE
jgi:iron(III) transport system substrate-binding protein